MTDSATAATTRVVEQFRRFAASLNGEATSWAHRLRTDGIETFRSLGFPTTRLEAWRYTNVASIAQQDLDWAAHPLRLPERDTVSALGFGALDAAHVVLVDGVWVPELSSMAELDGAVVQSLARAFEERRQVVEPHLGRSVGRDGFVALNTAFLRDGVLVHIPRGTVVRKPIHLAFISTAGGQATARHPRCLIIAEDNSQALLLESHVGANGGVYLSNVVTEVSLAPGAQVSMVRLQDDGPEASHVAHLDVRLSRDSVFRSHALAMGGRMARLSIDAVLEGEGAECHLEGLYLAKGEQHTDNTTVIDHAVPRCRSVELYKGVIDDAASSIFSGTVRVREQAQKTDAAQQNKNLVLSNRATANTRPQLEIYADDVKCSHGATVGQLDEAQLFYLRSRGIGVDEARRELTYAFAKEIVHNVPAAEVRTHLEALVRTRLGRSTGAES